MRNDDGVGLKLFATVTGLIVLCLLVPSCQWMFGTGGFGPMRTVPAATISRMWVDHTEHSSHYMVATDAGVFEVDNGVVLGMWNADTVYGQLREGHTYTLTTKGNRYTNLLMQDYPYIISASEVTSPRVEVAP